MTRRVRDPHHHTCVDRQTYHAMGMFVFGFALAVVLDWLGCPGWLTVVVVVVVLLSTAALHLTHAQHERDEAADARTRARDEWDPRW